MNNDIHKMMMVVDSVGFLAKALRPDCDCCGESFSRFDMVKVKLPDEKKSLVCRECRCLLRVLAKGKIIRNPHPTPSGGAEGGGKDDQS